MISDGDSDSVNGITYKFGHDLIIHFMKISQIFEENQMYEKKYEKSVIPLCVHRRM